MPGVYDDDNQGEHDDLGIHPEHREAEIEQLEHAHSLPSLTPDHEKPAGELAAPEAAPDEAEHSESSDLEDRLNNIRDRVGQGDKGTGFYRPGKGMAGKRSSRTAALRGAFRNKGLLVGAGGGLVGVVVGFAMLFNFLHTFQLDHFFKNIEQKTTSRLAASLDSRNKYLVQSYVRIRATEVEGGTAGDNLYFRAHKIDRGTPIADWYETMRASKFESDLLEKNGIAFTSMVDKDGNIKPARITGSGAVDPKLIAKYNLTDIKTTDDLVNTLNGIPQDDLEKIFTVDSFDSHKAARLAVKDVVHDQVPWWRVFKRRHMREDIANMTGIKNWRLFEKTRDKLAKDKQAVKDRLLNKIVDKYYANNPSSAQFLKCLFSNGRCSSTSDPVDPDNQTAEPQRGASPDELASQDKNPDTKDSSGKTVAGQQLDTNGAGNDIQTTIDQSIQKEAEQTASNEADQALTKLGPTQQIIAALSRTLSGDTVSEGIPVNPTKIWTWAKRIAKIDALLSASAGASKLAKMVYNARSSQLDGIYSTYQIANDQMKSGQLNSGELNSFFDTTKNLGNTEGWQVLTGQQSGGAVAAAASTNLTKQSYCDSNNPDKPRSNPNLFAWMCDDQKPGGSSNAKTISDAYNSSVGPIVKPVAVTVDAVQSSIIGKVADWLTGALDSLIGKLVDPVVSTVLDDTGVGKDIKAFMATVMDKMLGFLGAAPMFDGTKPGLGNLLVAGGAAAAENSTRASGGIKSTPKSLSYSNNLAREYQGQQANNESIMTRYASLDNPNSLASNALFAVSTNMNLSQFASKVGNYFSSLPALVGDVFTGQAFAQQQQDGSAVAQWAGVNTYDIPQACMQLDPLDPNYLAKSSNVQQILGVSPLDLGGYDTMRDTNKFWSAVYNKLGNDPDAEAKADQIYNCALLDARAMGDLGAVYGYNKDNGYGEN